MALPNNSSRNPRIPFSLQLCLLILLNLVSNISTSHKVHVYPLADEYFQKIYLIEQSGKQHYLTISCKQQNMLSVSLTFAKDFEQHPRFNIYGTSQDKPKMGTSSYTFLRQCKVILDVNGSNLLSLKRAQNQEPFFVLSNFTFQSLHNTIRVIDHSKKWGLGQRFQKNFKVIDGKWTLWNRDKPWKIDRGLPSQSDQTYGFQPIYLARNNVNKLHHLVYFKNTFGLLVDITNNASDLIYNSVGGPIHFIILVGKQNPEELLQKFHQYIGPAHIPPFWSLGYHQCRWGYKTADKLAQVLQKFAENDLPIDTIWSDLDYMDKKMIFTVNERTHGHGQLNRLMKQHDTHFVPLIDAGVSIHDNNAMLMGKSLDVFLKSPQKNGQYYVGDVWPGSVHFVDFLHPNAFTFWKKQLKRLYEIVQFSGIWLDMNEPSNFKGNEPTAETLRIQKMDSINQMTINVDIPHYTESKEPLKHRQAHTYYGHMTAVPTHLFFKEVGKRPFIISRSNSVGTGYFAGHWTGDNVANWQFLRASINGNFLFQIFGIQMVGSDICGFNEHTTQELCSRWYQVGSFYPFSRNHNVDNARDQEPYVFGQQLLLTSRISLKTRYALLRYMYSILVSKKGKGSFFRPLNFEFPLDQRVYDDQTIETQFLIGPALMIAPIVYSGIRERMVYFPGQTEVWYEFKIDIKTGKVNLLDTIKDHHAKGSQKIQNPLPSAPPTFLRSGYALLTTKPSNRVKNLGTAYHLFAALKNGESTTQIMAIKDYDNEADLSTCIESGCQVELVLRKMEGKNFSLSWSYKGTVSKGLFSQFEIGSIVAVEGSEKWMYEQSTAIRTPEGSISIEMTLG